MSTSRSRFLRRQHAFTLIEILVVVTIIAIIIAVVVLSVNLTGRDSELHRESKRLDALIGMAREQAEMQVRDFGLYMEGSSYRFMVFDAYRQIWIDIDDKMLRPRSLPQGVELSLVLEGRQIILGPLLGTNKPQPQILMYASGDLNSFDITMKRAGTDHRAEIKLAPNGTVEFTDVDHMPGDNQ